MAQVRIDNVTLVSSNEIAIVGQVDGVTVTITVHTNDTLADVLQTLVSKKASDDNQQTLLTLLRGLIGVTTPV